jgi:hypothetical protein
MSARGRLLFGLLFVAVGAFIFLIGLGVVRPNPEGVHAPLWVIACAGLVFFMGGCAVMLGALAPGADVNGQLGPWAPWTLRFLQYLFALIIIAALATVASWVAFGPGEREFSNSIALPFWQSKGASGETTGRIAFGVGAVMGWLIFLAMAVQGWRKLVKPGENSDGPGGFR